MDVKALYPSIDIDFATEKCVDMITESDTSFDNINADELGLYLALTVDKDELTREDLAKYSAKRKRTRESCSRKSDQQQRCLHHMLSSKK